MARGAQQLGLEENASGDGGHGPWNPNPRVEPSAFAR
uniref:Uncharacterized protein n=1 Tax=Arundo donax TaxID=35708 RepID=A0A0A9ALH9_ARUDO